MSSDMTMNIPPVFLNNTFKTSSCDFRCWSTFKNLPLQNTRGFHQLELGPAQLTLRNEFFPHKKNILQLFSEHHLSVQKSPSLATWGKATARIMASEEMVSEKDGLRGLAYKEVIEILAIPLAPSTSKET